MVKQGSPAMPKEPVQKGSKWSHTAETDMPQGKLVTLTTLTYIGPETVGGRQLERIDLAVTAKLGTAPGAAAAKGTLYFDNKAGRIDHLELVDSSDPNHRTSIKSGIEARSRGKAMSGKDGAASSGSRDLLRRPAALRAYRLTVACACARRMCRQ